MQATQLLTIFWFRRDLRIEDNHGFFRALQGPHPVLPLFIFDTLILDKLPDKQDRRVAFIHHLVTQLSAELKKWSSTLFIEYGQPVEVFQRLLQEFNVASVVTNEDFEPYSIERDMQVRRFLHTRGISLSTFKDHVIFDPTEILKSDGTPYVVYTPYSRAWKKRLLELPTPAYPSETHLHKLLPHSPRPIPSLNELGFRPIAHGVPHICLQRGLLNAYAENRNIPGLDATSHAGPHLRFGTVSIRHLVNLSLQVSDTWLNELIWREFFIMILFHYPHVVRSSFRPQYDAVPWRNNEMEFNMWCAGRTGYPLVDAGMHQLNATGQMHNRVRMVTASFLTKHLLIDWRWGEAYFAEKLLDFELASNNGNWQWAAGTGCDAAPYFRIFNPEEQANKFDRDRAYINRWIPNYPEHYPAPIVDHAFARTRALDAYKKAIS